MGYNQVIYGKLIGNDSYKIIAHTDEFDENKLERIQQDIIDTKKFWIIPPKTHFKRKSGFVAGGIFKYRFPEEAQDYLVIAKASIIPRAEFEDVTYQYHYLFIPIEDLDSIGNKTFYLLNQFFKSETIIPLWRIKNNLTKKNITLLAEGIPENKKHKEVQLIKDCISQEKDEQNKSFLFSALVSLINEQRVLIDHVPRRIKKLFPADIYYFVLLLLPKKYRTEISIVFGDINELDCNWADLLIKTTKKTDLGNLPQNCIMLDRLQKIVRGVNNHNDTNYGSKIEEIISRTIEETKDEKRKDRKIAQLLKDLETLPLKSKPQNLTIKDLTKNIEDIFQPSSEKPINLGIWGTTGSGKTTYLVMLHDRLSQGDSDFHIQDIDDEAQKFLFYHRHQIFQEGIFPKATNPNNKTLNIFTYTVIDSTRIISEPIKLSFIDAPGKFFEDIGERSIEYKITINEGKQVNGQEQPRDIVDYLIGCDGIIFLLDPKRPKNNRNLKPYQNLIPLLFQKLRDKAKTLDEVEKEQRLDRQTKQLKFYAALCVAKVDEEDTYWIQKDRPKEFIMEVLDRAYGQLNQFLYFNQEYPNGSLQNRSEFFAISSIGRYKENGKDVKAVVNSNQAENEESDTQIVTTWVFSQQESYNISEPEVNNDPDRQLETGNIDENDDDDDLYISVFDDKKDENQTNQTQINSQSSNNQQEGNTIQIEKNPKPHKVTEPLEWLIKSIQANQQ